MFTRFALFIVLLNSISSVNANTITTAYLKDSIIPNELKALILVDLQEKCTLLRTSYFCAGQFKTFFRASR